MARAKPVAAYPRKPNPPPSAAADAFVETGRAPAGEEEAPHRPAASKPPAAPPVRAAVAPAPAALAIDLPTGRAVMQLKDGRRVRRTTMLLGEELARRLDVFAANRGVDKAAVVNAALEKWLVENGA
jgi:hypothetical protein